MSGDWGHTGACLPDCTCFKAKMKYDVSKQFEPFFALLKSDAEKERTLEAENARLRAALDICRSEFLDLSERAKARFIQVAQITGEICVPEAKK